MFKQCLAVGKLVTPTADMSDVSQNLSDAQFGQGKIHDAQRTLRQAGLITSDGKGAPTSFLRYQNKKRPGAS
eukprot:350337-Chlamydomonas_euryale.AAC.7